ARPQPRSDAWLGNRRSHCARIEVRSQRWRRLPLSGALPHAAEGLDRIRMVPLREQPQGEVLPPHQEREEETAGKDGNMEPNDRRRRSDHADALTPSPTRRLPRHEAPSPLYHLLPPASAGT